MPADTRYLNFRKHTHSNTRRHKSTSSHVIPTEWSAKQTQFVNTFPFSFEITLFSSRVYSILFPFLQFHRNLPLTISRFRKKKIGNVLTRDLTRFRTKIVPSRITGSPSLLAFSAIGEIEFRPPFFRCLHTRSLSKRKKNTHAHAYSTRKLVTIS